jgi:N-acetylglucosaminyl-diphospho-decaprenol L-rhamnosyltransferase
MKLSIIITHHRTPELLGLCLKSIKETIGCIDHELIVVDGESEEKTEEQIKDKYPEVKLISFKKNLGYSKMVNAGIKEAKGDYVLILNADIIVLEETISEMIEFMGRDPKIGILAPQLLDFTGNIQISCFSEPTIKAILARRTFFGKFKNGKESLREFLMSDWDRKSVKEIDWAQGSAMMIKKEAIDKVGLFDEDFFMYFEDADLCRRFREIDYRIFYYPEAKMVHYYHRSSKKWGGLLDLFLNKYTRIHIISAFKYFRKYHEKKNK